ncbi:DUF167 domain-containing protein [Pelomicrobium sp. G1]|uniref:DUF167 domain-containing protein n=1 Tax=unclassified Pelomicrobium TaxID=2815318 RepID=UPI003F758B85
MKPAPPHPGGPLVLSVYVQPGARRTEVAGFHGDALKIRVAAPPVEGQANAELIRFLAEALDVPVCRVRIASGAGARRKRVEVTAPAQAIEALLRAAAEKDKR